MKTISNILNTILAKVVTVFAQSMVKVQPIWDKHKLLICLTTGFVLGIFIGWFILGYGIFAVEWTNASPAHLRPDFRAYYLSDVAEDFQATGDVTLAYRRIFGRPEDYAQAKDWPWVTKAGLLENHIDEAIRYADSQVYNPGGRHINATALQTLQMALPAIEAVRPATPPGGGLSLGLIIFLLLIIACAIAAALWFFFGAKKKKPAAITDADLFDETFAAETGLEGPPVKSFSTPYVLGDDYFDPSFSIEIGPDFLGECGIGISETLGAGDPKKVTAFEAWLFDKSDIRTITTVMASEYAYNDPDLRAKLEPKGDIVLLRPGAEVILDTTALRVKAVIKDLEYAQGNFPPNSFIQKATFELRTWLKEAANAPDIEYPL